MSALRPSEIPSFVYRQDGHELSYEIFPIIHTGTPKVKVAFALDIWYHDMVCYTQT